MFHPESSPRVCIGEVSNYRGGDLKEDFVLLVEPFKQSKGGIPSVQFGSVSRFTFNGSLGCDT